MNKCFWRLALVAGTALLLAGCGNKQTRQALDKASGLETQKQYQDANDVLVDALRAREAVIRSEAPASGDATGADAVTKKVGSDPEILKLERAQIPLYIRLERADLAYAVYSDILTGSPNDTVVTDLLHNPDAAIRTGAVRILGLAAKPDAIDALAAATKDPDKDVRRAAVVALGAIKGPATVQPLIDALKDTYWDVRSEAANALGQDRDPRAVKPIIDITSDSDPTVETSAETALLFLSRLPNVQADDFAARLNDPNPKVARICAVCLAVLHDKRAVPALMKMLASSDQTTRLDAVKGLGETGDASVIPTLRETLKDSDVNMRGWSIIGLGNLRDEGSLPDLEALANDPTQPDSIRTAATAAANHIAPQPGASAGP
jgi:HEAT repeat protein